MTEEMMNNTEELTNNLEGTMDNLVYAEEINADGGFWKGFWTGCGKTTGGILMVIGAGTVIKKTAKGVKKVVKYFKNKKAEEAEIKAEMAEEEDYCEEESQNDK